jgi:4-hydroxy-L-threonine phosphate dehydrogenase PdxA
MSSPSRAAKDALGRAAKAARGSRPAQPPAKPNAKAANATNSAEAKRLAAAIERGIADGRLDVLSADALQAVIAAACRLYTARREAGEQFMPVAKNSLSATDVMVTASGLLRAADLAAFELGMWQGWTGR